MLNVLPFDAADLWSPFRRTQIPAVSEAQRRLMFAAAARKGGVGGVSQSVGKEFADADKGGKLPEHVSEVERAKRRYARKS